MFWTKRECAFRGKVLFESQLDAAEKRWAREAQVPETPLPHPFLVRMAALTYALAIWFLVIGVVFELDKVRNNGVLLFVPSLWYLIRFGRMWLADFRVAWSEGVVKLPWERDPTEEEVPF